MIFRKPIEKIQVWIKSDKNNGDMKTYLHLWQYLTQFFLEWEMFQTTVVKKIKTHFLCSVNSSRPRKLCPLWDKEEKYGTAGQATDDNIIRCMRFACWITKARIERHKHIIVYVLLFHGNSCCANAPQWFVVTTSQETPRFFLHNGDISVNIL